MKTLLFACCAFLSLAAKPHNAGLISDATLATVQNRFKLAGTASYELAEP